MNIYPFETLCWVNKDENMKPKKFSQPIGRFSQLLKTNLFSKTRVSQAQAAFICSNSQIVAVEQIAKYVQS